MKMKRTLLPFAVFIVFGSLSLSQESKFLVSLSGGLSFPYRTYESSGIIYVPATTTTLMSKMPLSKTGANPHIIPANVVEANSMGVAFYNNYNTGFNIGLGCEYRFDKHFSLVGSLGVCPSNRFFQNS
jgi:hypothetical protein